MSGISMISGISNEVHPKAKEEFCCELCGHPIRKNERYWQAIYIIGDSRYRTNICRVCENATKKYGLECNVDSVTFFGLERYLLNTICTDCKNRGRCGMRVLNCPNIREAFGKEAEE